MLLALVSGLANADVDPYFGSFGTTVPIGVPAFHGLEPRLQLAYTSSGRNGTVGMGWALGGFSRIEGAALSSKTER